MRNLGMTAAAVLLVGLCGSAFAQSGATSPVGDWQGILTIQAATYEIGVHIEDAGAGAYKGSIGSHDTGRWGTELNPLTFDKGALSFTAPAATANFKGAWDPAASAYAGTYTTTAGSFPITFKAGTVPPLPTVAGLDGRWEGEMEGAGIPVVVRIATTPRGTAVMVDYPSMNRNNTVVRNLSRDGQSVALSTANGQIAFAGNLSADGNAMTGTWTQQTLEIPVTLKKKP